MYLPRWRVQPLCVRVLKGVGKAGTYYQGPNMLQAFLSFSRQYHLLSVQINPFRPSPIHHTKSQCFKFSVKFCSQSALQIKKIFFFSLEFKPTVCHRVCVCVHNNCVLNLSTSVTKPNLLMQYIAKVAVCCKIHKNHMKCIVRTMQTSWMLIMVVHKVTTMLQNIKY